MAEGFLNLKKPIPLLDMNPTQDDGIEQYLDMQKNDLGNRTLLKKPEILGDVSEMLRINFKANGYTYNDPKENKLKRALKISRQEWLKQWEEELPNTVNNDHKKDAELLQLIWGLYRTTLPLIAYSKLQDHLYYDADAKNDVALKKLRNAFSKKRYDALLDITVICYHCIKLLRFLSPQFEEQEREIRVRVLSHYGLALGLLDRTNESNRRLNEAHGAALSRPSGPIPIHLARIHVRRAEVYLDKAKRMNLKDEDEEGAEEDRTLFFAGIDDSWAAIERAENAMRGTNHSSFWWFRIFITKLSCYATLATKLNEKKFRKKSGLRSCLPWRRRQDLLETLSTLLRDCLINSDDNLFHKLGAVKYFYISLSLLEETSEELRIDDSLNSEITRLLDSVTLSNGNGSNLEFAPIVKKIRQIQFPK